MKRQGIIATFFLYNVICALAGAAQLPRAVLMTRMYSAWG